MQPMISSGFPVLRSGVPLVGNADCICCGQLGCEVSRPGSTSGLPITFIGITATLNQIVDNPDFTDRTGLYPESLSSNHFPRKLINVYLDFYFEPLTTLGYPSGSSVRYVWAKEVAGTAISDEAMELVPNPDFPDTSHWNFLPTRSSPPFVDYILSSMSQSGFAGPFILFDQLTQEKFAEHYPDPLDQWGLYYLFGADGEGIPSITADDLPTYTTGPDPFTGETYNYRLPGLSTLDSWLDPAVRSLLEDEGMGGAGLFVGTAVGLAATSPTFNASDHPYQDCSSNDNLTSSNGGWFESDDPPPPELDNHAKLIREQIIPSVGVGNVTDLTGGPGDIISMNIVAFDSTANLTLAKDIQLLFVISGTLLAGNYLAYSYPDGWSVNCNSFGDHTTVRGLDGGPHIVDALTFGISGATHEPIDPEFPRPGMSFYYLHSRIVDDYAAAFNASASCRAIRHTGWMGEYAGYTEDLIAVGARIFITPSAMWMSERPALQASLFDAALKDEYNDFLAGVGAWSSVPHTADDWYKYFLYESSIAVGSEPGHTSFIQPFFDEVVYPYLLSGGALQYNATYNTDFNRPRVVKGQDFPDAFSALRAYGDDSPSHGELKPPDWNWLGQAVQILKAAGAYDTFHKVTVFDSSGHSSTLDLWGDITVSQTFAYVREPFTDGHGDPDASYQLGIDSETIHRSGVVFS